MKFEITIVSADNLPDIRKLGVMKVYAVVLFNGRSETSCCDREGETNPRWNFSVKDTIIMSTIQNPGENVVVQLFCKRTLEDKYIGEVNISLKSLFDMGLESQKIVSYSVAGTTNGTLNILYSFDEKVEQEQEKAEGTQRRRRVAFSRFAKAVGQVAKEVVREVAIEFVKIGLEC